MTSWRARSVSVAILAIGLACVPVLSMRCSDSSEMLTDGGLDALGERRLRDNSIVQDDADAANQGEAGPTCSPPPGNDGLVHDWPGWTRLSGMDECCPLDSLNDLMQAVPYDWVPCDDAGQGCLRFNAPTSDLSSAPNVLAQVARGSDGAAAQVLIARLGLAAGGYEKSVYDFASGKAIGAWRFGSSSHCTGTIVATTDDSAMLSLSLFPQPFAPTTGRVVANGKVANLAQFPVGAQTGLPWNFLEPLYGGGRGAFANFSGAVATCDMHTPGSPKCVSANVASITPAVLNGYSEEFIEGEYVYDVSTHGNLGWSQEYIIGPTGEVKLLRGVANTHVGAFASDGKNLTWVEVQGDVNLVNPQKIEEVWTAPLTSDPTLLGTTAKKIVTLPSAAAPSGGPSFNGYYFVGVSQYLYIVRTSDGVYIKMPPMPPPYRFYGVDYITPTEVWVGGEHDSAVQLFRLTLPPWP